MCWAHTTVDIQGSPTFRKAVVHHLQHSRYARHPQYYSIPGSQVYQVHYLQHSRYAHHPQYSSVPQVHQYSRYTTHPQYSSISQDHQCSRYTTCSIPGTHATHSIPAYHRFTSIPGTPPTVFQVHTTHSIPGTHTTHSNPVIQAHQYSRYATCSISGTYRNVPTDYPEHTKRRKQERINNSRLS